MQSSKVALLTIGSLALCGCAGSIAGQGQLNPIALDLPETSGKPGYLTPQETAPTVADSDRWSDIVNYVAPEPELVARRFDCGVIDPSPPKPGPWRLVGISPTYYSPVLDIRADRTSSGPESSIVYYHFRLSDDVE